MGHLIAMKFDVKMVFELIKPNEIVVMALYLINYQEKMIYVPSKNNKSTELIEVIIGERVSNLPL